MLRKFEKLLTQEKYDVALEKASDEIPYDRLLVFLGHDYKERGRTLEVISIEQITDLEEPTYAKVQFQVPFPFRIEPATAQQVGSVLHFINRQLELPGFEMDEVDDLLFFRYVWVTKSVDETLFKSLLGIIMMQLELFTETIERVATGSVTFNDLLEEVLAIARDEKMWEGV